MVHLTFTTKTMPQGCTSVYTQKCNFVCPSKEEANLLLKYLKMCHSFKLQNVCVQEQMFNV